MTKPKAQTRGPSGPGALALWDGEVLPHLPDLSEPLRGTGIDPAAFGESLYPHLARYRVSLAEQQSRAQKAEVVAWLERAAGEIEQSISDGRLRALPAWYAEPAVYVAAYKLGHDWRALLRTGAPAITSKDCKAGAYRRAPLIARCLTDAAASLRRQRSEEGRPGVASRAALMRIVDAALLSSGVGKATVRRMVAKAVLERCGVVTPAITSKDHKGGAYRRATR